MKLLSHLGELVRFWLGVLVLLVLSIGTLIGVILILPYALWGPGSRNTNPPEKEPV